MILARELLLRKLQRVVQAQRRHREIMRSEQHQIAHDIAVNTELQSSDSMRQPVRGTMDVADDVVETETSLSSSAVRFLRGIAQPTPIRRAAPNDSTLVLDSSIVTGAEVPRRSATADASQASPFSSSSAFSGQATAPTPSSTTWREALTGCIGSDSIEAANLLFYQPADQKKPLPSSGATKGELRDGRYVDVNTGVRAANLYEATQAHEKPRRWWQWNPFASNKREHERLDDILDDEDENLNYEELPAIKNLVEKALQVLEEALQDETDLSNETFEEEHCRKSFERVMLTSRRNDDILTPVSWILLLDALYCTVLVIVSLVAALDLSQRQPSMGKWVVYEVFYFKLLNSSGCASFVVSTYSRCTLQRQSLKKSKMFWYSLALICAPLVTHCIPSLFIYFPFLLLPLIGGITLEHQTQKRSSSLPIRLLSRVLINFLVAVALSMSYNLSILFIYHQGESGNPSAYIDVLKLENSSRNIVCTINSLGSGLANILQTLSAFAAVF